MTRAHHEPFDEGMRDEPQTTKELEAEIKRRFGPDATTGQSKVVARGPSHDDIVEAYEQYIDERWGRRS